MGHNKTINTIVFSLGCLVFTPAVYSEHVALHTFENGTTADAAQVNANFDALLEATGADGINTDGSLQERMPFNQGNKSNWMLAEFQSATSPRGIEAEGGGRGEQLQLLLPLLLWPPLLPLLLLSERVI